MLEEYIIELQLSILNTITVRHKTTDSIQRQQLKNQELLMMAGLQRMVTCPQFEKMCERYYEECAKQ